MFIWLIMFLKGIPWEVHEIWSLTSPALDIQKSGWSLRTCMYNKPPLGFRCRWLTGHIWIHKFPFLFSVELLQYSNQLREVILEVARLYGAFYKVFL